MKFKRLLLLIFPILIQSCQNDELNNNNLTETTQVQKSNTNRFEDLHQLIQTDINNRKKNDSVVEGTPVVTIGNQVWMKYNLNVAHFSNGDEIKHAKTEEEWRRCCDKGIPAWCYIENNGKEYNAVFGKLYNEAAIKDNRGLVSKNWRIPNENDWDILCQNYKLPTCNLKSKVGWMDKAIGNCGTVSPNPHLATSAFVIYPGGYRLSPSAFAAPFEWACLWTLNEQGETSVFNLTDQLAQVSFVAGDNYKGVNIRCIKR